MRHKSLIALLSAIVVLSATGCTSSISDDIVEETEIQTETESVDEVTEEIVVSDIIEDVVVPVFTFSDMDNITMYAVSSVNVRNLPSTDGMKIDELSENQEVLVTGKCNETGWFRLSFDDHIGYVCSDYLTEEVVTEPEADLLSASPLAEHDKTSEISVQPDEPVKEVKQVDTFVQGEDGVSYGMIADVEKYYAKIPENVRNYFQNSGWHITVSASSLGPRYGYTFSILALTVYDDHQIWIDNRNSAKDAIVHEVGHFIDYTQGWSSSTSEFLEIYAAEKEAFCMYHSTHQNNTSTAIEYFAESFQQCVYDPAGMQAACPRTYTYIMTIANSL